MWYIVSTSAVQTVVPVGCLLPATLYYLSYDQRVTFLPDGEVTPRPHEVLLRPYHVRLHVSYRGGSVVASFLYVILYHTVFATIHVKWLRLSCAYIHIRLYVLRPYLRCYPAAIYNIPARSLNGHRPLLGVYPVRFGLYMIHANT